MQVDLHIILHKYFRVNHLNNYIFNRVSQEIKSVGHFISFQFFFFCKEKWSMPIQFIDKGIQAQSYTVCGRSSAPASHIMFVG